jgi:hypothetical protein
MRLSLLLPALIAVALASSLTQSQTCTAGQATKRALLIGINLYEPAGTKAQHPAGCQGGRCDLPTFSNLQGPVNDVEAIRDLLNSPKFGFEAKNVTVLTNPDLPASALGFDRVPASQTTHDGILAAMRKYLVDLPCRGDTVVFYYAGHGSLRVNSKGTKYPTLLNGKTVHLDTTLVASDAWTGNYDIRDHELAGVVGEALDKGIHVVVLLDSCHSGSAARGIEVGKSLMERSLGYDPRDIAADPSIKDPESPAVAITARAQNPAIVFAAAQQNQTAKEKLFGAESAAGEVHGAFTVALIQTLRSLPADAPASAVLSRVRALLQSESVSDQDPALDTTAERMKLPLFSGAATGASGLSATVLSVDSDQGEVLLDDGQLNGIREGSEFVSENPDAKGRPIRLRVESLVGLSESRAKVVFPAGASVAAGDFFKISKWVPQPVDVLKVWSWPVTLSLNELRRTVAAVKASGVTVVADPVDESWTDMLAWNGTAWELRHAVAPVPGKAAPPSVSLGPSLTAEALRSALKPGALLWVNLPVTTELAQKLALHVPDSLVAEAADASEAHYLLVGSIGEDGPQYGWYHKTEYDLGPPAAIATDHSPGCSPTSPFPVSSDWVPFSDADDLEAASAKLNEYVGRLAKIRGWLSIADTLSGESSGGFYELGFRREKEENLLSLENPVRQGDRLRMWLHSEDRVAEPRWVYVLDIDCHGKGTLLYPTNGGDNRFPDEHLGSPREFELPGAPTLRIGAPYGADTVLFISTQTQLPDPYALNFEGVGQRGGAARGVPNPLQQLLTSTSGGTRGPIPEMPSDWQIDSFLLKSTPARRSGK